jgi:hypothetical protein
MVEIKRLIGEVAAQHGIRLEADDPAFALVTLNQLVLEETANRLYDQVSSALQRFTESLSKAEHRAGKALAQEVKTAASEFRHELSDGSESMRACSVDAPSETGRLNEQAACYRWLAIGALSGLLLFVAGVAFGKIVPGL